ncbi:metallophosphoesterase family protein [Clostridia bacterium]|nr:metallophosphoesterase family protein [Clostridia bacterium]
MIRVGVISDTHLKQEFDFLPTRVATVFDGVDQIIHCGDINRQEVLDELGFIAPVTAVFGNTDPYEMASALEHQAILNLGDYRIGITHGEGFSQARLNALKRFRDVKLDILLYGHSHCPEKSVEQGIYCLNPGSATRPRCTTRGTIAILTLGDVIESEFIDL